MVIRTRQATQEIRLNQETVLMVCPALTTPISCQSADVLGVTMTARSVVRQYYDACKLLIKAIIPRYLSQIPYLPVIS